MHIISLGAGVQSSTMALMAAHGEIGPMPSCCVFADTQDEPPSVYDWLNYLEKQLPFPVHRVTNGQLSKREVLTFRSAKSGNIYRKASIPLFVKNPIPGVRDGIMPRKCTTDFKVVPLVNKIKQLAKIPRACKELMVIQWMGISRDEVVRMKPSRYPYIEHRFPLVDMNIRRADCLKWMEAKGYPRPPRSACYFCPYHSDKEWRRLKEDEPESFQKAVEFEKAIQAANEIDEVCRGTPFLHTTCVPLDQVDFSSDVDRGQQTLWGNECEGMCGM